MSKSNLVRLPTAKRKPVQQGNPKRLPRNVIDAREIFRDRRIATAGVIRRRDGWGAFIIEIRRLGLVSA